MADGTGRGADSVKNKSHLVDMQAISKSFGTVKALDQVPFVLDVGEIRGLVGENGAGKSTLMNILYGMYHPDDGSIKVWSEDVSRNWSPRMAIAKGIGMIHQHFSLISNNTLLENIVMPTLTWADMVGTARESTRRYRYLLSQGQTGLSVAFDLPTQIGYDADDPLAAGEVGRVRVSISALADMERLLDGLPLERVSTSMTINAPAAVLLAMYLAVAQRRGIELAKLRGTIQNDVVKEYVARGTYIYPPQPAMRLVTDVFRYCKDHVPRWNTISISGYHMREAGATAAQEIAFTLANAIAYTRAALTAGLSVDDFAPQLAFLVMPCRSTT